MWAAVRKRKKDDQQIYLFNQLQSDAREYIVVQIKSIEIKNELIINVFNKFEMYGKKHTVN